MKTILSHLIRYHQVLLFIAVGIILWAAIGLQLFEHDTPCHRCWEIRGVYLIILQLLWISLLFGYREPISLILIALFILLGNDITMQQLVKHTINLTKDHHFTVGYGAYASFLGVSLTLWNLIIANLAILYIATMNYLGHFLNQSTYLCKKQWERILVVIWGLSPLLLNAYLFILHLKNPSTYL